MDALRSCYITTMRFPGVGLVPVRWYWTDKDWFPGETVYASHNWIREPEDEFRDTGEPGEVWGAKRIYVKGEPPVVCTCTGPEGDALAWMGESDSASPLFDPCTWGYEYSADYSSAFDSKTFADGVINE